MTTKAVIKKINKDSNLIDVRIPLYEKSGSNEEFIVSATICYIPGCLPDYQVDDVVYVAFENDKIDKPIIIGKLYLGKKDLSMSRGSSQVETLKVDKNASLPKGTTIGDVSYKSLKAMEQFILSQN